MVNRLDISVLEDCMLLNLYLSKDLIQKYKVFIPKMKLKKEWNTYYEYTKVFENMTEFVQFFNTYKKQINSLDSVRFCIN